MMGMGARLMALGLMFLLGAGIYWVAQTPTDAQIETERYIRNLGSAYGPGTNEIRLEHRAIANGALWPAGIGVVLLGIGWAMGAGAGPLPPQAKKDESEPDSDKKS